MTARRRVLFVSHEATLTGAPMNLLHLVRWARSNADVEVHTLLLRDGPMHERFAEVGPVTALDDVAWRELFEPQLPLPSRAAAALRGDISTGSWVRRQVQHLTGFDLVYANSVASVPVLPLLPAAGAVVSHVHEMGVALEMLSPEQRWMLCTIPSAWIAASGATRDDMVQVLGLDSARVHVHHEFIEARQLASRPYDARAVERLRREQAIPDDAAIVMGAGTLEWRKGPDLFIQVAAEVARRTREPIRFVWVGGHLVGTEWTRLWADCGRAGVRDLVRFVGTVAHPETWFSAADVFVLPSHEDPYPLVCLEQASIGHPVVTFRNGGMVELLEPAGPEAAACVVDHLDVAGMTTRVLELLASDDLRVAVGRQLRDRVLDHHDVAVAAPALWALVEDLLP